MFSPSSNPGTAKIERERGRGEPGIEGERERERQREGEREGEREREREREGEREGEKGRERERKAEKEKEKEEVGGEKVVVCRSVTRWGCCRNCTVNAFGGDGMWRSIPGACSGGSSCRQQ